MVGVISQMICAKPVASRAGQCAAAVWLASIAMAVLLLAGCKEQNEYKAPPPPKVTVAKPVQGAVTDYLEFTGNTQAIYTVQLRARVEGYLDSLHFQDGADVKKGDLLFSIQPDQYQAQLQQALAEVQTQQAALDHAETELKRYSRLYEQKAAAATDVDNWRFQRDSAKAALMNAQAQVDLAKLNLSYTRVTAPFSGRMGRRLVDPGNLVGAGGQETTLAEINQIDPIYAYFTISEIELLRVRKLQQEAGGGDYRTRPVPVYASLANEQNYPHEGRIDFAAITVDPSTGTLLLRAVFPNADRAILPGLFVRLRVPVGRETNAILIPEVALGLDQIGRYVLVVNDKNVVERRAVKLGQAFDTMRVIDDGLKGDERVVVNGLLRAIPGREVSPEVQEAEAPKPGAPSAVGG
jgi:membrane fusion protein, multidrug efflux system